MGARIRMVGFGSDGGTINLFSQNYRDLVALWGNCLLKPGSTVDISGDGENISINPNYIILIEEI